MNGCCTQHDQVSCFLAFDRNESLTVVKLQKQTNMKTSLQPTLQNEWEIAFLEVKGSPYEHLDIQMSMPSSLLKTSLLTQTTTTARHVQRNIKCTQADKVKIDHVALIKLQHLHAFYALWCTYMYLQKLLCKQKNINTLGDTLWGKLHECLKAYMLPALLSSS